jgi:hypothetical protein
VTKRHSTPQSKRQAVENHIFTDAKRDATIVHGWQGLVQLPLAALFFGGAM